LNSILILKCQTCNPIQKFRKHLNK